MSKSMPPIDLLRSLSASSSKPKPPPSEKVEDKVPAFKTKPVIPPSSSVRHALVNRDANTSIRHTVNLPTAAVKDQSPTTTKVATSLSTKTVPVAPVSIHITSLSDPNIFFNFHPQRFVFEII